MIWSRQQSLALDAVASWMRDPGRQLFYLAGYAGTGKTTLAQHFAEHASGIVIFAAFTGKAASVLRSKGAPNANTLHHYLYNVEDADRTELRRLEAELAEAQALWDSEDMASYPEDAVELSRRIEDLEESITNERARIRGPRFHLNPDSLIRDASLVVLDEGSMINQQIGDDLLSFGTKVLVLGDPAQLPPVRGSGYFTRRDPDILLTEIHRQAADNPIIQMASAIRKGETVPFGDNGRAKKIHRHDVDIEMLAAADQVLCGTNKMRRKINRRMREHLGHSDRSPYPVAGDKLVILRNDREYEVMNGVTCEAKRNAKQDPMGGEDLVIKINYEGRIIPNVPLDRGPFDLYSNPDAPEDWMHNRHLVQMDYGYALTVHKAQGSQWPEVLVYDDGFAKRQPRTRQQWLYTAVTRAEERLVMAT